MPTMKYLDYDGLDYFWDKINAKKQDKLTAGSNITISGNTISATQPTVGNATLTIQKNGTNVQTFTANATSNKTANITVPTKTSELTNDSSFITSSSLSGYLPLTGGTLTGKLTGTQIETGTAADNYFQSQKFRGQGDASSYYHAIDFGYGGHNQVDFYEYGGVWNFWRNTSATATTGTNNLALGITLNALKNKAYTYTFPNKTGTFALTSDLPTVNNATLTIQKNGTTVKTFTANASSNVTANITVPTTVAELSDASTYVTQNSLATQLANKQNVLTAGDHINITGSTIKAVDYVHSDDPVSTTAVTPVVTNNMIVDGTITADKFATGATLKLTLSTSDIGEGAALAANTLYGVYS